MADDLSTIAAEIEVKHGYTLRDLDQMTRAAVIADRSMASDIHDRKDTAWSAIAEHLCTSEEPPERQELIRVGWQAIYRDARKTYRQRGRPDTAWAVVDQTEFGEPITPRFAQYWRDSLVTPSHEGRVVEHVAVSQVLTVLTPIYRDAIVALAVHDDYRAAAQSLGIKDKAFQFRISKARRQLLAKWFEGETPRRTFHTDRRVGAYDKEPATHCPKGHEWTPENTHIRRRMVRGKPTTSRVCRACEHDRSVERARVAREAREDQPYA